MFPQAYVLTLSTPFFFMGDSAYHPSWGPFHKIQPPRRCFRWTPGRCLTQAGASAMPLLPDVTMTFVLFCSRIYATFALILTPAALIPSVIFCVVQP